MKEKSNIEVVKGERVGVFSLGMSKEDLLQVLKQPYTSEERYNCTVYEAKYMFFFINHLTNKLDQICMFKGFKGKFLNQYGIGDNLLDVDPNPKNWSVDWEASCYSSASHKGIIFGLEENATMNEVDTGKEFPIGWICIAHPSKYEEN
ncbi:hypothetical protein [Priestia aryabhattai]